MIGETLTPPPDPMEMRDRMTKLLAQARHDEASAAVYRRQVDSFGASQLRAEDLEKAARRGRDEAQAIEWKLTGQEMAHKPEAPTAEAPSQPEEAAPPEAEAA